MIETSIDYKVHFLKQHLGDGQFSSSTGELLVYCCFCFHHKKKLSINVKNNVFKCWVCDKRGKNFYYLLKQAGCRANDLKQARELFGETSDKTATEIEEHFALELPPEYTFVLDLEGTVFYDKIMNYLNNRGLSRADIIKYKIGYCTFGQYSNRIIIPFFNIDGSLNYFTSRTILKHEEKKYIDPLTPKGYKTSIIPNEIMLDYSKPIFLYEGFFDGIYTENSIPLLGSTLHVNSKVFQNIVKNKSVVYLALDSDAVKKTIVICEKLLLYDVEAYWVDIGNFKDVNSMPKELFMAKIAEAQYITKSFLLRKKIQLI